jgi:CRP/FNR family transcriptional regulator, cyclic AMP receptor protein
MYMNDEVGMEKSLYETLPEAFRAQLQEKDYAADEVICAEGEEGQDMYFILSGAVIVCKQIEGKLDTVIAQFGPGEYFGEFALFDQSPRSATVQAEESSRLVVLNRADLERLIEENAPGAAQFLLMMLDSLTGRLRTTNERLSQSIRWGLQIQGYELEDEESDGLGSVGTEL